MPYHCGALLPTEQRYTNLQFRRLSRYFRVASVDYDDAICLAAFLRVVPPQFASWIFHWTPYTAKKAHALLYYYREPSREYARANFSELSVEDGLRVLQAMQDGGWTRGPLPKVVKRALKELHHLGRSVPALAKDVGLSVDQVKHAIWGARGKMKQESVRATAALGVG